jgi:hypothetical protein
MEALLVSDLGKNISIFSQTHRIRHIILFFKVHSKYSANITEEKEQTNSSKSFSVKSLRLPRGTLGVSMSSSSIIADIEDVCSF